jgi:hypothetical protein
MSFQKLFDSMDDSVDLHDKFGIDWSIKGVGFGQFYFYEKDGVMYCDNEIMSKNFIKMVLCKMVDRCELTDIRDRPDTHDYGNPYE